MSIITFGLLCAIVVLGVLAARATGSRLDAALAGASFLGALAGVVVRPVTISGASIEDAGLLVITCVLLAEVRGLPVVVARRARVLERANEWLYDQRLCHAVATFQGLLGPAGGPLERMGRRVLGGPWTAAAVIDRVRDMHAPTEEWQALTSEYAQLMQAQERRTLDQTAVPQDEIDALQADIVLAHQGLRQHTRW